MGQTDETGCKPGCKQVWAEELIAKENKIRIRKKFQKFPGLALRAEHQAMIDVASFPSTHAQQNVHGLVSK